MPLFSGVGQEELLCDQGDVPQQPPVLCSVLFWDVMVMVCAEQVGIGKDGLLVHMMLR